MNNEQETTTQETTTQETTVNVDELNTLLEKLLARNEGTQPELDDNAL